jgi:hypothetical protein
MFEDAIFVRVVVLEVLLEVEEGKFFTFLKTKELAEGSIRH